MEEGGAYGNRFSSLRPSTTDSVHYSTGDGHMNARSRQLPVGKTREHVFESITPLKKNTAVNRLDTARALMQVSS